MTPKKGAIALSINMLVVVIISLVILGAGVSLLYKFIGGAEELKRSLDQRTNEELDRLLINQGQQVALPRSTAEVFRGDEHVFGIGILNIDSRKEFSIEVHFSTGVDESGNKIDAVDETEWLLYNSEEFSLEQNENQKEAILVIVPNNVVKGQYIFNAKVYSENEQYGNTQKMVVVVK